MTTKNSEFVFDLQAFATDTRVVTTDTLPGATGTVADTVTISATSNGITANAGWALSDTVVTYSHQSYDPDDASVDPTITGVAYQSHSGSYSYVGFSSTDTSAAVTIVESNKTYSEITDTSSFATLTAIPEAINDTLVSAPVTITGGTGKHVSLNAIGYIDNFADGNSAIALDRASTNLRLIGVGGTLALTPTISGSNGIINQTINGAAIRASVASGSNVTLDGSSSVLGVSAGSAVTLNNIDTLQNWIVGSDVLTYNRLGVSTNDTVPVTVTGSSNGNYLATTVEEGLSVKATTTPSNANDTLDVNGVQLHGAGKLGAVVTAENASVLSVAATISAAFAVDSASVGGAISSLAAGGTATVSNGDIVRVDTLVGGANWTLGTGLTEATLGSDRVVFKDQGDTLTADANGTKVAAIALSDSSTNVTLTANDDHNVSVRSSSGAANWDIDVISSDASISAVFDQSGNANISTANGTIKLSSSKGAKTLNAGNADAVVLANGDSAVIVNGVINSIDTVETGSAWTVKGGTGTRTVLLGSEYFSFAGASSDSLYGVLTTSSQSGASVSGVSGLSNNVTVNADTISGLNVMGTEWTVANPGYAMFDSTGAVATVTASSSDLSVASASTDAKVQVTMLSGDTMAGTFNGVGVRLHDSDSVAGISLENAVAGSGILGITSLNSGATITGDNEYTINDTFNVHKAASKLSDVTTQITLGADNNMTVQNVVNGDNYSVTGGTVYYDINSTVASGGTASLTVNNAPVTISASTDSAVRNAYIVSNDSDAVVSVTGVRMNDTVTSATDTTFGVTFNVDNVDRTQSDTTNPYKMNVNKVSVSVVGSAISSTVDAINMAVTDSTAEKPTVSISSGLANNATVTVGAGYYIVGGNAAVEVNDSIGYLYINNSGGVTAEDYSVADVRMNREASVQAAVDAISNTVQAYEDFYNVDYSGAKSFPSTWTSTIAGYAAATTTSPTSSAVTGGVNIYGDVALGGNPQNVTLRSFISNPIKIDHTEGNSNGDMRTAVIDVQNGNASLIAIGMDSNYSTFATNHSILGSAKQSTIAIGPQATGNNVVKGGNGGNYIYHNAGSTGGVASLYGGTGVDTIYAGPADHVEGGTNKDYFFDSSPIEISDYNFEEGDVIVASKLSSNTNLTLDKLSLNGNKIAIANGSTITVGSSANYDEATATRAVIAHVANNIRTAPTDFLVWAGNYESVLDASNFTNGAMMISHISDINGTREYTTRADTITGSSYGDTIYAGSNDYVDAGAGNDIINIFSSAGSNGASVVLSNGVNSVVGWQQGFDNTAGANILIADPQAINFKTSNKEVVAWTENSSITFNGLTTIDGAYRFLVGTNKFSYIEANTTALVNTNADVGDYYKAERNGGLYVASDVTTQFTASLGTAQFLNITKMDMHNESRATVWGSSANETITANGSRSNGARKYVAAGDGNDLVISGGNSTVNAGNNLYFGTSGGTVFGAGRDTIQNFGFYRGSGNDPDMSGADLLYLGDFKNYSGVNVTANQVEISLGEDKVIVRDDGGFSDSNNKIMRVQFDNSNAPISNIKFGVSNSVNSFTYDGETDIYWGNTSRARDILNVTSEANNVNIWLGDKNYDTVTYGGIGVINATLVADTKLTLAGSAESNIIYAGGNNTSSSLWGGGGASNTLVGGAGEETFFYFKNKDLGYTDSDGNKHSSSDNIDIVDENDLIWLYDVTINDIDFEKTQSGITNNKITVTLTDGTEIGVTHMSTNTNFRISNGQGGWTDVRAVNSGNNRHWE